MVFVMDFFMGEFYINVGSFDNCDLSLEILIVKVDQVFGLFVFFDCMEVGVNYVNFWVIDEFGNCFNCLVEVIVCDFFDGVQLSFDVLEICFEVNNFFQLDFCNYFIIILFNGFVLIYDQVENSFFFGDGVGVFGIMVFVLVVGFFFVDLGVIFLDGIYELGEGMGFVIVFYVLVLFGFDILQNGNFVFVNCFEIVYEIFEFCQLFDMLELDCECIVQNECIVDFGIVIGGFEFYIIQYDGG